MRAVVILTTIGMALALLVGQAGCSRKAPAVPPTPAPEDEAERERLSRMLDSLRAHDEGPTPVREAPTPSAEGPVAPLLLSDIHFEYDRAHLTELAQSIMADNALALSQHAEVKIILEGHCDERGSNEYNLALGERRASTARDYLANYGIEPIRLRTVSYGEERPLDPGHDERAWAKNRRAHFVIFEGGD